MGYKWELVYTRAEGEEGCFNMGNMDLLGPVLSVQSGGGLGEGSRHGKTGYLCLSLVFSRTVKHDIDLERLCFDREICTIMSL